MDERSLFTVRGMEPEDAAEVATLCGQLGYDRSSEAVRTWIGELRERAGRQAAFVAVAANEVVGWIEVSIVEHLQTPRYALIGGLVVRDGARGGGIGRLLCQEAEAWSWSNGMSSVRVTSRSTRIAAHGFYLRDGYRELKMSTVFEKPRP